MSDQQLANLFKTQKSLTEWFEDIKHHKTAAIRKEDNTKRDRLNTLNQVIGLPFDKPVQFPASALNDDNQEFISYLKEHGHELCALRLTSKQEHLPKLRMRGHTVANAYQWFKEQKIDAQQYLADFIPHVESEWATIFIVNKHGIQGEIAVGGHHQLTQGFHDQAAPHVFRYDFKEWSITPHSDSALDHLKQLAKLIHVPSETKRSALKQQLNATFSHNYLEGYFETTESASRGIWFIDYNQTLGELFADIVLRTNPSDEQALAKGQTGSSGKAKGPVRIISPDQLDVDFPEGSVLVCKVTTPHYVPLMQKASAIVTDQGGILSHAAIVAREMQKPCIVGTGNATAVLQNDSMVHIDADAGTVNPIAA